MKLKNFNKKIALIHLSALFLFSLHGCVEDDLSVCGVTVTFEYIKNLEGIDKFATNVDKINLFVYDIDGNFVGEYTEEGASLHSGGIRLNLVEGAYQIVAWGNMYEEYELSDYENFDEAVLSLKRANNNIVSEFPTDLFHACTQIEVNANNLETNKIFKVGLTKFTNNIKVTASGLPSGGTKGTGATYNCSITAINGDYKFDESFTGTDRLQYIPETEWDEEGTMNSDFVIMRELNVSPTNSKIVLTASSPGSEEEEFANIDLREAMIIYSLSVDRPGDLDIEDEFEIEIVVVETNGTATIYVNGWEYTQGGGII